MGIMSYTPVSSDKMGFAFYQGEWMTSILGIQDVLKIVTILESFHALWYSRIEVRKESPKRNAQTLAALKFPAWE